MQTESTQEHLSAIASAPSKVRLTQFDRWWASLVPPALKRVLPPWQISAGLVTLMALYADDQVLITMIVLFWASISFTWLFRKFDRYVGHFWWLIPIYHAGLFPLVVTPAMAQAAPAGACTTNGLFSQVTNFISQLFQNVTFGGVGGGTLSGLICQVVGFLTVALLLGFLGVLGYVAFQIGYNRQPISTVLEPLMGFLIFAGGSTVVIGVMVGTAGGGAAGGG